MGKNNLELVKSLTENLKSISRISANIDRPSIAFELDPKINDAISDLFLLYTTLEKDCIENDIFPEKLIDLYNAIISLIRTNPHCVVSRWDELLKSTSKVRDKICYFGVDDSLLLNINDMLAIQDIVERLHTMCEGIFVNAVIPIADFSAALRIMTKYRGRFSIILEQLHANDREMPVAMESLYNQLKMFSGLHFACYEDDEEWQKIVELQIYALEWVQEIQKIIVKAKNKPQIKAPTSEMTQVSSPKKSAKKRTKGGLDLRIDSDGLKKYFISDFIIRSQYTQYCEFDNFIETLMSNAKCDFTITDLGRIAFAIYESKQFKAQHIAFTTWIKKFCTLCGVNTPKECGMKKYQDMRHVSRLVDQFFQKR